MKVGRLTIAPPHRGRWRDGLWIRWMHQAFPPSYSYISIEVQRGRRTAKQGRVR